MLNFAYLNRTRLIFGRDTHKDIGSLVKKHADRVLLHYGGGSIIKTGLYSEIVTSLQAEGITVSELGGVLPNPRLSLVREGIRLCRQQGIRFILAVGGGSAIDSAKAIAMGVPYDGDPWDIFTGAYCPDSALDLATILTLPATGSESSNSTVITNEANLAKRGVNADCSRPLFSIVNPELFFTLPACQIANGAADMLSHVLERYITQTRHTDLTDGLCESTVKTIVKMAPKLLRDPHNYDAWADLALAGNIAHNGILGLGRQEDWGTHGIEHELSAHYDVAHGAGLAAVTAAWMRYVYRENPEMFVQFAVNVMGVQASFRDQEGIILAGIDRLESFYRSLGLPTSLRELGIGEEKFELMAKSVVNFEKNPLGTRGRFKAMTWQDVLNIYRMAL